MFNKVKLYAGHIRNSKKVVLVSTIGLICAIAIVSSSLLYVDSTKGEIVDTLLNANNSSHNYDISLQMSYSYPKANTFEINSEMTNITNDLIAQANLNIFTKLEMTFAIQDLVTPQHFYLRNNDTQPLVNLSVSVVQLNDGLRNDLKAFTSDNSSLPSKNAPIQEAFALESLFGSPISEAYKYYTTHDLLDVQNSTINKVYYRFSKQPGYNFNITGHYKFLQPATFIPQTNSYSRNFYNSSYPALSRLWYNLGGPYLVFFVNNLTRYTSTFLPESGGSYIQRILAYGGLNIDFTKVDPLAIASRTSNILKFTNSLQTKLTNAKFYQTLTNYHVFLVILFTTQIAYSNMANATTTILFNMWIYALPILIISLLMANYSFGLIHKKVVSYIGIYKTRGASRYVVLLFELIDFLLILILSLVAGTLAGIPISSLVTKTDFLLSFNKPTNYDILGVFINNLTNIIGTLFVFSIVISLFVNLRRTIKLANISIVETEDPTEKVDPYWKKHYLDGILFLYGLVTYAMLIYFLNTQAHTINPIINLFLLLAIPGPFAMVIGTILLCNRIIPVILNWIGTMLWHRSGGLLAFSFKNVLRHHQASTRAIMLIASLLTFLVVFYSMPYSEVHYQQQTSLFENGAEGVVSINTRERSNMTVIQQLLNNVSHVVATNFSNELDGYSAYLTATIPGYNGFGPENFLFINTSSYMQASSIKEFRPSLKSGNTLEKDLQLLKTTNNTILMNKAAFNDRLLSLNENITIKNGNDKSVNFKVIDSFNIWPSTSRYNWDTSAWVIMDINHLLNNTEKDLTKTIYSSIGKIGFYLNFKAGVNKTAITQDISVITGQFAYVSNFEPQNWDIYNNLIFQFQIGQINTDVLMSLLIGVIILIMFAYMQMNDRKKEIYTELALGMKISQTSVLFFVESIILLISGIFIGTLLGVFFVQMLAIYMTRGSQIPPYEVIIPWNLVLETYLGFILLSVLSSIIPAYYVIKQDISKAFITDA